MTSLEKIELGGRGRFLPDVAGFEVNRYHLDRAWDYILGDSRLYWRLHQNGHGYLQEYPPGGTYWLRSSGTQEPPPWDVIIIPDDDPDCSFTNFRGP